MYYKPTPLQINEEYYDYLRNKYNYTDNNFIPNNSYLDKLDDFFNTDNENSSKNNSFYQFPERNNQNIQMTQRTQKQGKKWNNLMYQEDFKQSYKQNYQQLEEITKNLSPQESYTHFNKPFDKNNKEIRNQLFFPQNKEEKCIFSQNRLLNEQQSIKQSNYQEISKIRQERRYNEQMSEQSQIYNQYIQERFQNREKFSDPNFEENKQKLIKDNLIHDQENSKIQQKFRQAIDKLPYPIFNKYYWNYDSYHNAKKYLKQQPIKEKVEPIVIKDTQLSQLYSNQRKLLDDLIVGGRENKENFEITSYMIEEAPKNYSKYFESMRDGIQEVSKIYDKYIETK